MSSLAGGWISKKRGIKLLPLLATIEIATAAFGIVSLNVLEHVGDVKILLEQELNGIEVPANGNVEYVKEKMILLLEAKADDFAMGRAQNYVECEVGYEVRPTSMSEAFNAAAIWAFFFPSV